MIFNQAHLYDIFYHAHYLSLLHVSFTKAFVIFTIVGGLLFASFDSFEAITFCICIAEWVNTHSIITTWAPLRFKRVSCAITAHAKLYHDVAFTSSTIRASVFEQAKQRAVEKVNED